MRVVIVGGGLMGAATAFFLARRGIGVTLIERDRVGQAATNASFGNIRRQGRHLPQLPLAHRSRALWGETLALLDEDVEFRATGHVRFAFDEGAVADMEAFARDAAPLGLTLEILGRNELRARFPWAGPGAIAASFSPEDGSANPRLIAPAFARAAARLGAEIAEDCPVTAIESSGNGLRVETARGTFPADAVLNAAGAWGARLAERLGEPVPIEAYGPQMGVTEPLPHRILPVVGIWSRVKAEGVYFRQVERGNIVFGGGKREPVALDPGHAKVDPANTLAQLPQLARLCPAIARVQVIRTWSGCEGYTGDMLPVMGPSRTAPGVFHAFGFCGHGFQLGPGVGDVMAELIATGETPTPIAPYCIARFAAA
ncbi:FAD-binding oxidoreductase [Aurantimonas sp. VKM B-3413]|uniref:NAD(P)/FAD-dependent oxidoreductase n=1 Tax=Aurantimonas sp. VKM B-3413 TaxID=2779401 RepID=UPI001E327FE4|nr:FAD-binding oxidoreductase [Aurantimonas sp. VKM B-3413]MCB8840345.1 FAD-binding oxidoreductase [Aurantimonas sp. VKM B-3413]